MTMARLSAAPPPSTATARTSSPCVRVAVTATSTPGRATVSGAGGAWVMSAASASTWAASGASGCGGSMTRLTVIGAAARVQVASSPPPAATKPGSPGIAIENRQRPSR
ncbi:MAG: hypothetical protein HS111_13800 [Kofleriaceae bacterium]|nr:hypothetical protein [Kofleriaceae bacterium]